jgi:hypothetical protein
MKFLTLIDFHYISDTDKTVLSINQPASKMQIRWPRIFTPQSLSSPFYFSHVADPFYMILQSDFLITNSSFLALASASLPACSFTRSALRFT